MDKYLYLVWDYRHIGLVAVALGVYAFKHRQNALVELKAFVASKMLYIEKKAQELIEMHGPEKMEWVVAQALEYVKTLPFWLQPFMTEQVIRVFCQWVFDTAMDYLDDGSFNKSFPL